MYYITNEIACSHYFCHDNDPTPAPTLYWNYVLGYEIRHTDYFCCHDIEPPPPPHPPYHPTHFVLELWLKRLGYK